MALRQINIGRPRAGSRYCSSAYREMMIRRGAPSPFSAGHTARFDARPALGYPAGAMFITLISLTFAVLVVAVVAADVWAANQLVERLWPKEDMANQLKPAGMPSAADSRRIATPSTEAPRARPDVQLPVLAAPWAVRHAPTTARPSAARVSSPSPGVSLPVRAPAPESPASALLGKHGGDRKSRSYKQENQACNDGLLKHGTAAHWKARLRRDDPDLSARVDRGELSANAAAVLKGWRKAGRRGSETRTQAAALLSHEVGLAAPAPSSAL